MTFGQPWMLVLLPAVPLLWGLWLAGAVRGRRAARSVSRATPAGPPVTASILLAAAIALAIAAAAQPRWGEEDTFIPRRGADLVVVLDVSRSMGARDVAPSRLAAAKKAIAETFERLGGDRAGVVIFAGDAIVRAPLTHDLEAAARIVNSLEPGPILVGRGTNAAAGLDIALSAFPPESEAGRLILFIGDGDDLGVDPRAAAARVASAGASLLVAGAGTPGGATVPVRDGVTGEWVDLAGADGIPVITRLDEQFLRALAAAGGGQYLGPDLSVVPGVVASRMAGLASAQFDQRPATLPVERGRWFALAAAALAAAASVAERFRPGRRAAAFAAASLALVIGACASDAHRANEDGLRAFEAGDYGAAAAHFVEAQAGRPEDPAVALNLAAALHAAGRYEEAAAAARRALSSPSIRWRARARASIGHHRFALGDLPAALEAFKQALLEDPGDTASRHDYEVVLRLLTADETRPGPPGPPGGPDASQTPGDPGEGSEPAPSEPGEGPPEASDPGEPGQPGAPGDPGSLTTAEIEERLAALQAEIASLVEAAGEQPTAAEALEILRLLEEYSRLIGLRAAFSGMPDPSDY